MDNCVNYRKFKIYHIKFKISRIKHIPRNSEIFLKVFPNIFIKSIG